MLEICDLQSRDVSRDSLCYPIFWRKIVSCRYCLICEIILFFLLFPSFLWAFLMIRYAPVNQILGGKSMLRSIRYANGWSNSTSGGLCIWNLSIDTRISLRANTRWWYVSYRVWIVTELLFKTRARRYTCYQSIQFVNTICADFSISLVTRYHVERSGS